MRINAITNNTSFHGTVMYNDTLVECMKNAKDKDLEKFEKLIGKIKSVDDGWQYLLDVQEDMDGETLKKTNTLVLSSNSLGCTSFRTIGEETVRYLDRFEGKYYKKALKKMVSLIEDDYKKAQSYNSRRDLEHRIYEMLGVKHS